MSFASAIAARGLHSEWDLDIDQAAGADPTVIALTKAIIARESQWVPSAVNPSDPSYGLMQILYGPGGPFPSYTTQQLLDPVTNIELGMLHLRGLLARYGDVADAVAAYNAGTPRRNVAGQYINSQGSTTVNDYVDDVLDYFTWYVANDPLAEGATPAVTTDGGAPATDEAGAGAGAGADSGAGAFTAGVALVLVIVKAMAGH